MKPTREELQAELDLRNRQLEAIHKISAALSTPKAVDGLLEETLAEALQAVQADAGSILLYQADRDRLVFRHVVGSVRDSLLGREMEPSEGICGHVFTTGQPSFESDVSQSKSYTGKVDEATGYTTHNMVTIPLMAAGGQPIGVMQILNKHQGQTMFDEHDIDVLMGMSSYAAAIIMREEAKLAEVVHRIGNISHDIKNMITPVETGAQTLEMLLQQHFQDLDETLADPSRERDAMATTLREKAHTLRDFFPEVMQMLLRGSRNVQEYVREIADCVKGIVAEPTFEMCNINDIVKNDVVEPLRFVAEERELTLDIQGLGPVPGVPLDRKRMFSALYNLVDNAIPETPPGGTIAIRTRAQLEGGPFPEGHYLEIQVADNGRGMPEQVREKLFTPHVMSTKAGGTGLGTRIAKNAVDAHHGQITVESQEGVGTTFRIKIPLEQPEKGT